MRNIVLENPEIRVRVSPERAMTLAFLFCCLCFFWLSGGSSAQILGEPKEKRRLAAEVTLKNPLPETLEDCCFSIEGANLTGGNVICERLCQLSRFHQHFPSHFKIKH